MLFAILLVPFNHANVYPIRTQTIIGNIAASGWQCRRHKTPPAPAVTGWASTNQLLVTSVTSRCTRRAHSRELGQRAWTKLNCDDGFVTATVSQLSQTCRRCSLLCEISSFQRHWRAMANTQMNFDRQHVAREIPLCLKGNLWPLTSLSSLVQLTFVIVLWVCALSDFYFIFLFFCFFNFLNYFITMCVPCVRTYNK